MCVCVQECKDVCLLKWVCLGGCVHKQGWEKMCELVSLKVCESLSTCRYGVCPGACDCECGHERVRVCVCG